MDQNVSYSSSDAANEEFWDLANSSSDEELMNLQITTLQETGRRRRRGSIPGRIYKDRQRFQGHETLYNDYFAANPVHEEVVFRRRFWMHRHLFLQILAAVEARDSYFVQKRDSAGRLGLSSLQKVTAAMRMLAYGIGADVVDDYLRIGESTAIEAMRRFVQAVIDVFRAEYLRRPTSDDISKLLLIGESRGFPGMLGRAPPVSYKINEHEYTMGYYLADGIYPSWATFVKTIPCPQGEKAKNFAKAQEGCRKDVERAFGVLQARFAIVRGPARCWDREMLQKIMTACVIMHNMIIEDERVERAAQDDLETLARQYAELDMDINDVMVSRNHTIEFEDFISNHLRIRDKGTHTMLQADLVEHLWQRHLANISK
ncbi:uncharacterized protein LOC112171162 [Rosa chinensis]|uniref:uncharacterized protein LOC112171162 n=1 Tax=Rosa chinensis TaxID=74649 RepID=UPI001AD9093F|nr:uncharacterized protein LOC112171162 [Rosa chinensis]